MSEHAESAPVAFSGDRSAAKASPEVVVQGRDWPLAAAFLGGVAGAYLAIAGVIYLAVTTLL
jgi:hypothetical protein